MSRIANIHIVDAVKEITTAAVSNSNASLNAVSGKHVAEFMQEIYNKLKELAEEND